MVALNSSTRRHQLLISVHTYASHFIAYSRFNNIDTYSREREKRELKKERRREEEKRGDRNGKMSK